MGGYLAADPQPASLARLAEPPLHSLDIALKRSQGGFPITRSGLLRRRLDPQRPGEITDNVGPYVIAPSLMERPHPVV